MRKFSSFHRDVTAVALVVDDKLALFSDLLDENQALTKWPSEQSEAFAGLSPEQ